MQAVTVMSAKQRIRPVSELVALPYAQAHTNRVRISKETSASPNLQSLQSHFLRMRLMLVTCLGLILVTRRAVARQTRNT